MPQSTLLNIYNSLVQSHFDYCSLVWGNCGKTSSSKLQKLQNRAARVITSSSYDVDVDSLFHNLSWKELHSQRQIQKAFMVFKSLNGLVPEYLTSKFVTRNVSNYALRDSANKLVVPFPRTNYMKNSFSYSGATLWNSLPHNIRESGSLNQFKRLPYHNQKAEKYFLETSPHPPCLRAPPYLKVWFRHWYFSIDFAIVSIAVTVSSHLHVVCRHFICQMSLFQGHVPC